MKNNTVIIIGAAGAGKTSVGRELAKMCDRPFFDTDIIVEAWTGQSIAKLFALYGEAHFRELEKEAVSCACLCAARTGGGCVISVGGGAVMDGENAAKLKRAGQILWLERDVDELARDGRPLYNEENAASKLLALRAPVYGRLCDARIKNDAVSDAARAAFHRFFT